MSTKIQSNIMVRHDKIPFQLLVDDDELVPNQKTISHGRDAPKFKNLVDRFVGNLRKQRRYVDDGDHHHQEYRHERLRESFSVANDGETRMVSKQNRLEKTERSSSFEDVGELCRNDFHEFPSSAAFMGRRRSRSDSDLIASEIFARRRAAICEEMERNILMENGITLRKCRKNLVLNQILENLSLL